MDVYLKGYYGFKNIGDELLFIGIVNYLYDQHAVSHVTVEVDDVVWMDQWIKRHQYLLPMAVVCVKIPQGIGKLWSATKSFFGLMPFLVIGGGEVINTTRPYPHNGRNYIYQYWGNIIRKKYMLLGGVTIKEQETPWHVSLLLSKAQSCVMRDSVSYKYVKKIAPDKTTMYHDFALDVVRDHRLERKITEVSSVEKNYVIVNSHPSLIGKDLMGKIDIFLAKHSDKKIYFFPGDMAHDRQCFEILHKQSSSIQRYDWTKLSLAEILSFVANADEVIAARLHIVFMCHMMRVPYAPLVYQAKVQKVIDDLVAYQKKENEII